MLITAYIEEDFLSLDSKKYVNKKETVVQVLPTKKMFDRVQQLQIAVKNVNAMYIDDFNYAPKWEELYLEDSKIIPDIARIVVDKSTIHWTCIVKHTNIIVRTEVVDINKFFSKFINKDVKKITGTNNTTPYEKLKSIANFAVDDLDIEGLQELSYTSILNFLDDCTNEQIEQQIEFYGYPTN